MKRLLLSLSLACLSCSNDDGPDAQAPAPDPRVAELREVYALALEEAEGLTRDGWLVHEDCDGALWSGKYGAATGASPVNFAVAEVPGSPGRFERAPLAHPCSGGTNELWSSWSRDMGTGLIAYAWRKRDLALLLRHEAYGRAHSWRMGEPVGDGRSIYTPSMIGRVYQAVFALGGGDNPNRYWPDLYARGLTDYRAHLQVMSIWQRGELEEAIRLGGGAAEQPKPGPVVDDSSTPSPDAALVGDVTEKAMEILRDQAARDPRDPLFQAVLGVYTGDMTEAITACLAPDQYAGEYVRCSGTRRCQLAAWVFACDLVLRRFPEG